MIIHTAIKMNKSYLLLLTVSLLFNNCATTGGHDYPGHQTFTSTNINKLHVGMNVKKLKKIFGINDDSYISKFGSNTKEEWTGKVLVYFTDRDERLKYVTRYKKNLFVFYQYKNQWLLNHWIIEK